MLSTQNRTEHGQQNNLFPEQCFRIPLIVVNDNAMAKGTFQNTESIVIIYFTRRHLLNVLSNLSESGLFNENSNVIITIDDKITSKQELTFIFNMSLKLKSLPIIVMSDDKLIFYIFSFY